MDERDAKINLPKLFACPNEGCIRVYKRYGSMVNHVTYGKCEFQPERESLMDTAKIMCSKKLWGGEFSVNMGNTGSAATVIPIPYSHKKEEEGWALRATNEAKAFSEKQRKFLEEKFMLGETTGRKLDPVTVARQMKIARDVDGQRLFSHEEVLSSTQIQSFFSKRAKFKNSKGQSVTDKDYEAAGNEEAFAALRNEVVEHIQPKHPVMYDGYNLCDLVTSQKLSKLKISTLSEICRSFKLEVTAHQAKRKAPFVGALTTMVSKCFCYHSATSFLSYS